MEKWKKSRGRFYDRFRKKSKLLTGRKRPPYLWGSTSLLWHRDFLAVASRLPCCGISTSLLWRLDFPHEGVRNFNVSRLILQRVASKSATWCERFSDTLLLSSFTLPNSRGNAISAHSIERIHPDSPNAKNLPARRFVKDFPRNSVRGQVAWRDE